MAEELTCKLTGRASLTDITPKVMDLLRKDGCQIESGTVTGGSSLIKYTEPKSGLARLLSGNKVSELFLTIDHNQLVVISSERLSRDFKNAVSALAKSF